MAKKQEQTPGTVKIRDLYPPRKSLTKYVTQNEFQEYLALAINAIKIECSDSSIKFGVEEETFAKTQLIMFNNVGFDRLTKLWAQVSGFGLNIYGNPTELYFIFANGQQYKRRAFYEPDPAGAYRIQALPARTSYADMIRKATDTIQICDEVILQNLQAVKTPAIITVKDKDTRLSVLAAVQDRQAGEPVIVIDNAIADGMKGIPTGVQYIADKIYTLREQTRDQLLNKLATMSANINKKERVQVGEVNATVGQCEDYIYSMIDHVNAQFISYDLPFKMALNTSLEELYMATQNEVTEGVTTPQNSTTENNEVMQ